jgi:hypothetical protein
MTEGDTMSIPLPPPIALYVQLENAGDIEMLSACFVPHAMVHDEGHTYEGLAAITGDFPGSPVTVHFEFVLEAGKIRSLEIHA